MHFISRKLKVNPFKGQVALSFFSGEIMTEIICKAVLFDLDGTLVDSGACIEDLWREWAEKNHIDVNYVHSIIHGRTIEETLSKISPYFSNEKCVEEIKSLAIEKLSKVAPVPGAVRFLSSLPLELFAVVTSGAKKVALPGIYGAGLPVPDCIITAEDVSESKPSPEPYLLAAERLNKRPEDCLVFEDADAGITSALAAGMRVVVVGSSQNVKYQNQNLLRLDNFSNVNVSFDGENIIISL